MKNQTASSPSAPQRKVVDALTRALHAWMAFTFALAYLTSEVDGLRRVHVSLGYTLAGLLVLRLAWGVLGPRRVGLRALANRLSLVTQAPRLLGQADWPGLVQLLLAMSMVVLLACVLPVVASGYMTYFEVWAQWMDDVHESLANLMLAVVICHVGSIALLAWRQGAHRVRPMITGKVPGPGPDLVKHGFGALAAALLLLLLVLGFWGWQAYQYTIDPQCLAQPAWMHPVGCPEETSGD